MRVCSPPPRAVPAFVLALAGALPLLLGACDRDPEQLAWQIEFASRALRTRAAVVEARIVEGGCSSETIVYSSTFRLGDEGSAPPELDEGTYGFVARARDANCYWYAEGCTEARLPRDGKPVRVEVAAMRRETLDCESSGCTAALCRSRDDGGVDGGPNLPPDGGMPDAALTDAGEPAMPPDAGTDAGTAPLPDPVLLYFEVEAGNPSAPFEIVQDDLASGGAYVSYPVPMGADLEQQRMMKRATPPDDDAAGGIAVIDFELPRTAAYRLWGRVITPSLDDDSFWVRIDDGDWIQWNDISHQDQTWHWDDVRPFEMRADRWPVVLGGGAHQLRIAYRELGARIDRLALTSELDWVPTD